MALKRLPQAERLLSGTLSAYISAAAVQMTVNNPPDVAKLPTYFELEPDSTAPETVRVIGVTGNVCDIERGVYTGGVGTEHLANIAYKQKITQLHWDAVVAALESGYITEDASQTFTRNSVTEFQIENVDHTVYYQGGRILRINGTADCTVVSSVYAGGHTVVTVAGDNVPTPITSIELGIQPRDMTALALLAIDTINEKTSGAGVTVDSLLIKDGGITLAAAGILKLGASFAGILDANGNELLKFIQTASAVNELTLANAATGANPILSMTGETDVGLDLKMKGAGKFRKPTMVELLVVATGSDCAVGDGKFLLTIPEELNGMNLTAVHAAVYTAGTTGTMDIQLRNITDSVDMLSTKITIDSTEVGSDTAATPAVIDTTKDDVATHDRIAVDIDAVHTTAAKGLVLRLRFELPA